ncbi:MAG: YaiI/YqxD family protein [Halieaceae bacterium]|nr:YaiI/YqxD family protein [Halieaceae bacterium]
MSSHDSIWVDADACPKVIRDILFRAAQRAGIQLTLVANHALPVPKSPLIKCIQVEQGFDMADNFIVQHVKANDLVITSDIPLAAELIEKGAQVITSRGEKYTRDNVRQRLNMRDFMDTMRSSGEMTGGPPALGQRERQAFANGLDQYLAGRARKSAKETRE